MLDRSVGRGREAPGSSPLASSRPKPERKRKSRPHRMRDGHRREVDAGRDRLSYQRRLERALVDVGVYRSVSFRDLAEAHFDGHPYVTRRAVNQWIRAGAWRESTVSGPKGNPFKVLTATRAGAELARRKAVKAGLDPGQRTWSGLVKPDELSHDTEIYRAAQEETKRLLKEGSVIRRIRIDAELKSIVAKRSETARAREGKTAADTERIRAAKELSLPVDEQGKVHYPDVQIEYIDRDGETDQVNVEVATKDYRNRSIQAKAAAGFVIHGNGRAGARVSKALGGGGRPSGGDGSKGLRLPRGKADPPAGGTRGPADREDGSVKL